MINLVKEYNKIIAKNPERAGKLGTSDVAEKSVRELRNEHLKESDWVMASDVPESTKTPWIEYRQQLRDLPSQEGFPLDCTWPSKPGEQ